jgi:hypothetical protein
MKYKTHNKSNMNKIKFFLLFIICNTICFAETQASLQIEQNNFNASINENDDDSTYLQNKNSSLIIKISPFQIITGDFITNSFSTGFSFEKEIKKTYSTHIGARYIFTDKSDDIFDKKWMVINVAKVNGFALDTELRKYLEKDRSEMSGSYLSINIKAIYTKAKYQGLVVNRFSTGSYINIGWQEIFDSGIVLDIAIGGGLRYVNSNNAIIDSNNIGGSTYHFFDGGKKPYHTGSAFFPFINLNFSLGYNFNK